MQNVLRRRNMTGVVVSTTPVLTSNTVSFTSSLLLHHCYHHTTLSISHRSRLCFGTAELLCSVCVLTFGVLPSLQLFFDSAFELAGDSFPDGTCL